MNLYVYILLQPKKPWVSQQNLESWRQAWPVYNLILVIIIKIDSPEERFLVHPDWRLQISLVVQSHSWFNTGNQLIRLSYLWQSACKLYSKVHKYNHVAVPWSCESHVITVNFYNIPAPSIFGGNFAIIVMLLQSSRPALFKFFFPYMNVPPTYAASCSSLPLKSASINHNVTASQYRLTDLNYSICWSVRIDTMSNN